MSNDPVTKVSLLTGVIIFVLLGGVQHLVRLLNGNRDNTLGVIADCLHVLAHNHEETKLIIYNYRGPLLLIKIIAETSYEKLLWLAGRLIKILALCPNNKHAIVQVSSKQFVYFSFVFVYLFVYFLLYLFTYLFTFRQEH